MSTAKAAIRELLAAGAAFQARGDLAEAERCFQRVVLLDPRHAGGLHGLGRMAHLRGDADKAAGLIGRALTFDGRSADAHHDLGLALSALGRAADAIAHFRRAAELQPSHAQACLQLATHLDAAGDAAQAEEWKEKFAALTLDHAASCMRRGETHAALALLCRALEVKTTVLGKTYFVAWLRGMQELPDTLPLAEFLPEALSAPWCRPQDLAPLAVTLLKARGPVAELLGRDPGTPFEDADYKLLANNRLLRALLKTCPLCDLAIEALLVRLRRDLLERCGRGNTSAAHLDMACALAQQCFINEYVWDVSPGERLLAGGLRDGVLACAAKGEWPPALSLAMTAAYASLELPPALTGRAWPVPLAALLAQQVAEPARERTLRDTIPNLAPIENAVSLRVRAQYEENPYPRWTAAPPQAAQVPLDDAIRSDFPRAPFRPLARDGALDILVAGCGTGQQAIETARQFAGARVLAVDLSLSSLAYAKRKTEELGIAAIDYAQADILALPALGREFDMVDTVGVLHHMADPLAGWRALLAVLRPGGMMRVGLYSAFARTEIVAAQEIARGFAADLDGIRACRRAVVGLPGDAPARRIAKLNDFYAASECRDLLQHVQEHRFTIPQIAEFIAAERLSFIGFLVPPATRDAYAAKYPKDRAMTDLGTWHRFETERPQTFVGMYQFWVQKPAG
ncbi:MAG: methyltransferase domain-containing protein [Pseudorhodoplanes sp.]